ncbi:MAG: GAF domain-containing protein, partial [Anaerolineae bacterium]|nr:GAF domain-containing protein [Anaerolineae bacterium]
LDFDTVLARILANVGRVVPHDAANIALIDGDTAHIIACRGYEAQGLDPHAILQIRFSIKDTPDMDEMRHSGKPFIVTDTANYAGWHILAETQWVRAYLGMPIVAEGQTLGFISLDSTTPGSFTQEYADRLQACADQAAIAIRNAQLYRELAAHSETLELAVQDRTKELRRATERIEAILNSSSDVIILAQPDGTIRQGNLIFYQLFSDPDGEAFGRSLTELVDLEQVDLLMETLHAIATSKQPRRIEVVARCHDGTHFDADMALSPITDQDGQVTGVICSMRDISTRKRGEEALRQALVREMEVNDMRSRFISMASHDLRTPLTVILSGVDMVAQYGDRLSDEKKQAKFEQIRMSVKHMVELLDDILFIGRVEAGRLHFNAEPVEVETFCYTILADLQMSIGIEHTFDFTFTGEGDPWIVDPKLLRHIVVNLLSNAIKYSPAGSTITFDIRLEGEQMVVCVQDKGIGIPEADQKHLFGTYHRAANVGAVPGTGLGLVIVKQSVELHGGTIIFESEEGVGSTFTVTIPKITPEEAP